MLAVKILLSDIVINFLNVVSDIEVGHHTSVCRSADYSMPSSCDSQCMISNRFVTVTWNDESGSHRKVQSLPRLDICYSMKLIGLSIHMLRSSHPATISTANEYQTVVTILGRVETSGTGKLELMLIDL